MPTQLQKKIISFSFLTIVALVLLSNVFITMWIVTAIGFNMDGLPYLSRGSYLETKGNILTMESLFANRIRDYNGLVLQAFKNISIVSFSDLQRQSALIMNENGVTMLTKKLVVKDTNGKVIFKTESEESDVTAKKLNIQTKGGHSFRSSIETQKIRAGPGNSLDISSSVGQLKINGPQKIDFKSFGGDINIQALGSVQLKTKGQGSIALHSGLVKMPGLVRSHNQTMWQNSGKDRWTPGSASVSAYQVCSCRDGKLFIVEHNVQCVADYHICNSQS